MKNLNNKSSSNLELLGEERNTPLNYEAERALLEQYYQTIKLLKV